MVFSTSRGDRNAFVRADRDGDRVLSWDELANLLRSPQPGGHKKARRQVESER